MERNAEDVRPVRRSTVRMQYGLSDTPLTSALEGGEFEVAEKLIIDNTEPDYLDEGPFDRIPLAIVLNSDPIYRKFPRNLRLARLLVEKGADPNLRIPLAQLQRSSPSPMEYLVKFCEDVLDHCDLNEAIDKKDFLEQSKNTFDVIGLQNEDELTAFELKKQLLELLDVFLAHGGNPNVVSTSAYSSVYHTVLRNPEPCMTLVLKLSEAGGDLNQFNAHRTTPLMDLVTYAELDTALEILTRILEINPDISSLRKQNCCNHTALWRAMLSGSPQVAKELLKRGASTSPRAILSQGGWYRSGKYKRSLTSDLPWGVSAIFAPFLGNSAPYIHFGCVTNSPREFMPEDLYEFNIDLFNKVMSYAVCPVIDDPEGILFTDDTPDVQLELKNIIAAQTFFKMDQLESPITSFEDVSLLMFGNLRAGLQQLCIRQILRNILQNSGYFLRIVQSIKRNTTDVEVKKDKRKGGVKNSKRASDHWMVVQELTPDVVKCLLLEHLRFPPVLANRFRIEAARLQLGACLFTLETADCYQACDGESDEGSVDPSSLSDTDEVEDDDVSSWLSESSQYEMDDEMDSGSVDRYLPRVDSELIASSDSSDETTSSEEDQNNVDLDISNDQNVCSEKDNNHCVLKNVPSSENSRSTSGDSIPHSVRRDEYEQFSNEFCNSDISPGNITSIDDEVHSE